MKEIQGTYRQATGELPFRLTNDYLFRALLQKNNEVLKHLTCSLMRIRPEEVKEVKVENPIVLGEAVRDKEFILDVKVSLNSEEIINYEIQVANRGDWPMRSLVYLCREFDQLQHGEDYRDIRPVTHIGFLDFPLFPEKPEFYATYRMQNVRNHHLYTDRFTLSVVDLNQVELATEEDRAWRTDYWAALFKATTWEEVKGMAEKDEIMREAADTVYLLTQDDLVRERCWAREDYYRTMRTYENEIRDLKDENGTLKNENDSLKEKIRLLEMRISENTE